MNVTSALFEAFLKCPTKCYLRSTGQAVAENAYAEWVRAQNDAYQSKMGKRVIEAVADTEGPVASPTANDLKTAAWRLAMDLHVEVGTIESRIHAVERLAQGACKPAQFIPTRFTFFNKLTKDDRLLVAFDALVLSEVLGREVSLGKIIHGDSHASLNCCQKQERSVKRLRHCWLALYPLTSSSTATVENASSVTAVVKRRWKRMISVCWAA